jgi:hypothetical protein
MAHDDSGAAGGEGRPDRFVSLLEWLIGLNGDLEAITRVISADTLRNWRDGKYPKQRSTSAVAAVDRWARDTYPGAYPPAWAPGGLIALAGRGRARAAPSAANSPTGDSEHSDGPLPRKRRRWAAGLASLAGIAVVVALIVIALVMPFRHAASPSWLYARGGGSVAVRACPDLSCPAFNRPTGTRVTMICYRDAQRVNLNYSSPRWFDVRDSSGATGWVHSSEVANQTRVGLC